ncbi:hypothetical protein J3458_000805 [Metarhizium acridum]|uniref:Uncharacterized protein n=1 Tax=Metarhizium acridum (strain CQMa 102) TaxID=655827 RepID=E9E4I2_METAQ|nr:uncharacterized protein MAC_04780 [Metarhizium acridum CQMa 102]EFY89193.1 hypothetical protein MAC_04780 [Metarhizium acridum CQMa 102]KAG8423964.1 hypothetical protein J3458_000805 [Metarhizium acridum]
MNPRSSFAASDTTYHSFHDIELQEPPSPPRSRGATGSDHAADGVNRSSQQAPPPTAVKMQRRDSGYESHQSGSARTSISHPRPVPPSRRMSSVSSAGGAATTTRTRTRPPTRPSAKSYPQSATPSLYPRGSGGAQPPPGYFQFPAPDLVELAETASRAEPSPHLPPPTTHYWTSDSTRRIEYAAIDAASRGIKGWIRRHLVPDCFTPRHVAFDDDSGSVRRYRLELEEEQDEKVCPQARDRRKGWHFFSLRKSSTI